MDSLVEHLEITRYNSGETVVMPDVVLKEYRLLIIINGVSNYHITCTKTSLQAFVVGYLFSENLIKTHGDIQEFELNETNGSASVRIASTEKALRIADALENGFCVSVGQLLNAVSECSTRSQLFLSTGAVHSCALCDASGILYFEEDISRHNALDKIIGYAVMNQVRLDSCYVVTSGRVPSDMLEKIVRAGIPLVASRSAPTDSAVRLAKKYNMTLIGFARGSRMNLYSCPQRVAL